MKVSYDSIVQTVIITIDNKMHIMYLPTMCYNYTRQLTHPLM